VLIILPLTFLISSVSTFPCFPPAPEVLPRAWRADSPGYASLRSVRYRVVASADLLSRTTAGLGWEGESVVLVVDARGNAVLDVLARAWCSSTGWMPWWGEWAALVWRVVCER
jgi:hypothetical protein